MDKNAYEHYSKKLAPMEFPEADECEIDIKNIGWTLGNECPYRCTHCYSMSARVKGMDLNKTQIDRIIGQLKKNGFETVNLGGNEPIFTNGIDPKNSLLPYIIEALTKNGIKTGLTTSGISLIYLYKMFRYAFDLLNDVDVSLDSPDPLVHNKNRGANLYKQANEALQLCKDYKIDHSIIMCAMNWNFSESDIYKLLTLASDSDSNIRINVLKPVESSHMTSILSYDQYYKGFEILMNHCTPLDLGEPPIATVTNYQNAKGCPCGRTSFRIHSITPEGKVPVSPCVYMHDFKTGDLLQDELYDIIRSPEFKSFRRRNKSAHLIKECSGCELISKCKGGCAARSYLHHLHETGERSLFVVDPYCPKEIKGEYQFPQKPVVPDDIHLVHMDYLCTWIGKPIN